MVKIGLTYEIYDDRIGNLGAFGINVNLSGFFEDLGKLVI